MPKPRIAIGAFMLESNGHSPLATREEFAAQYIAAGEEMRVDWESDHPRCPVTTSGFVERMTRTGAWEPVPLYGAMVGASGPVEHGFFLEVVQQLDQRLRAALPVDGVFLSLHGGAIGEKEGDPEGVILERVRSIVGKEVPIVARKSRSSMFRRPLAFPSDMPFAMMRAPVRCAIEKPSATRKMTFLALAVSAVL